MNRALFASPAGDASLEDAMLDAGGPALSGLYHWLLTHPGTNKNQCAKTMHMGKDRLYALLAKLAGLGLLACNRAYQGIVAVRPGPAVAGEAQPAECDPLQDGCDLQDECVPPQATPAPPTRAHARGVPNAFNPNVFKDNGNKTKKKTETKTKTAATPPVRSVSTPQDMELAADLQAILPITEHALADAITRDRVLFDHDPDDDSPYIRMVWKAAFATRRKLQEGFTNSAIAYFRGVLRKLALAEGERRTAESNVFLRRPPQAPDYYDHVYKRFDEAS